MNENEERLQKYITEIKKPDHTYMEQAQMRLDSLAKPPGSLGRLEDIAVTISGITGKLYNSFSKRCVIIMASDNGVTDEGVASAPRSVTHAQTINFTRGITGVAVLAKQFNADLIVVDVGVDADIDHPGVINRKIRKATNNIAKHHAMSRDEAVRAILVGIEIIEKAADDGYQLIGTGEMGIGNTTTASTVLCALTGLSADLTAGKGAGLDDGAYEHKKAIINQALSLHKPNRNDPLDVLAKVGGFDIAAMVGVYLGAAYRRLPVVIDGFISAVAALVAVRLAPIAGYAMLASHASYEHGFKHAMSELGLSAYLSLDMRLGEGSGCPLMFSLIDAACAVIKDMGTFAEASIDEQYLDNIKDMDSFIVNASVVR